MRTLLRLLGLCVLVTSSLAAQGILQSTGGFNAVEGTSASGDVLCADSGGLPVACDTTSATYASSRLSIPNLTVQPGSDTTTCVQVLDQDGGNPILNIDCVAERIGINIAAPIYKLHVKHDAVGGNAFLVENSTGTPWFSVSSGTVSFNSAGGTSSVGNAGDLGGRFNISNFSNSGFAALVITGVASPAAGQNIFEVNSVGDLAGDFFQIDEIGSVGIGTTAPKVRLDVNGRIHGTSISAAESYRSGVAVTLGTDSAHDVDVAVGVAQSFDATHDVVFASAQAGKQLDVKWATGAVAGMLGMPDLTSAIVLTFSLTASPDTITAGSGTPFAICNDTGAETGTIIIQGGSTNDGTYEVASCTDTVLTLGEAVLSGDETGDSGEYESRYVQPDTWYHVYLIESAGTEDICADTSEIATNCLSEASYDQYRFLNSVLTGATGNIVAF